MQQTVPLDTILLTPTGAPAQRGNLSTVNYRVYGASDPVQAMGAVRLMPNGTAVSFVVLAADQHFTAARSAAFAAADSLAVLKTNNNANTKPTGAASSWQQALNGRTLRKYRTGSGYSERTTLRLCAEGSFVHAMGGSSHSTAGTGAFTGQQTGRWQAYGTTNTAGQLVFENAEGKVTVPVEDANARTAIISLTPFEQSRFMANNPQEDICRT